MNLKASTTYTFEIVRDYMWFNIFPVRQYRKVPPAVLAVLTLVVLASFLGYLLNRGQIFITMGIVLLVVEVMMINMLYFKPKKAFRTFHSQVDSPNAYTFYEEYFLLRSDRTVDQETEIFYGDLYRAYETEDYFLLYTIRRKACVVGKKDFTIGSAEDLRTRLQDKMGNKFKVFCPLK